MVVESDTDESEWVMLLRIYWTVIINETREWG